MRSYGLYFLRSASLFLIPLIAGLGGATSFSLVACAAVLLVIMVVGDIVVVRWLQEKSKVSQFEGELTDAN